MMRESNLINSWIREGEDRGLLRMARANLLTLVQRLEDPVPESMARLLVEESPKRQPRKAGSAKGILTVIQDDDEHLEDFEEYMP